MDLGAEPPRIKLCRVPPPPPGYQVPADLIEPPTAMDNIQKLSDRELFSELFDNPINLLFLNISQSNVSLANKRRSSVEMVRSLWPSTDSDRPASTEHLADWIRVEGVRSRENWKCTRRKQKAILEKNPRHEGW